jgi:hypothetical protein
MIRQVFWLSDHPTGCAFPQGIFLQWLFAAFVPDYRGGTAPGFHGIPYYAEQAAPDASFSGKSIPLSR